MAWPTPRSTNRAPSLGSYCVVLPSTVSETMLFSTTTTRLFSSSHRMRYWRILISPSAPVISVTRGLPWSSSLPVSVILIMPLIRLPVSSLLMTRSCEEWLATSISPYPSMTLSLPPPVLMISPARVMFPPVIFTLTSWMHWFSSSQYALMLLSPVVGISFFPSAPATREAGSNSGMVIVRTGIPLWIVPLMLRICPLIEMLPPDMRGSGECHTPGV